MKSRRLINIFEDKISGEEIVDYLLNIGTSGGFYDHTIHDILQRKFELKKVSIQSLRQSDQKFNEWLVKQELEKFGNDQYSPKNLRQMDGGLPIEPRPRPNSPVVVVDGKLRDGWHRTAGKFAKGEQYVTAYVA